jgi:hypothetical protein
VHVTCLSLHSARNGELVQYDMQYWILSAHKVLTYIEYRAVSGVFRTIDPPPSLHPASVSSILQKGGECTHSPGGEGSIFWKTPDIGLASYSTIPLRVCVYSFLGLSHGKNFGYEVVYTMDGAKRLISPYSTKNVIKRRTKRHAICGVCDPGKPGPLTCSVLVSNSAESHSLTSHLLGILL